MQLFDGYGCCEEYPITRAWRDIRVTRIFARTNELMKTIAARFMGQQGGGSSTYLYQAQIYLRSRLN